MQRDTSRGASRRVPPRPEAAGGIFNLASAYVSWEEIASMAIAATGGKGRVEIVDPKGWTGAAFLADEARYEHYDAARRWERDHLDLLLSY